MSKAIIEAANLPPINIKGDPIRLLRFRLISTTKNIRSQWSTIFPLTPPNYQWISVVVHPTDPAQTNSKKTPFNISFNGVTNTLSWTDNSFWGTTVGNSADTTTINIGSHNLRIGDYVYVRDPAGAVDYAVYSAKRDGIYQITGASSPNIEVNLAPATAIMDSTPMFVQCVPPSAQYDIYLQFEHSLAPGTAIEGYSWTYHGTYPSSGSLTLPTERIPTTADIIKIAFQRPTNPKKRYNVNDENSIALCPIVVAKTSIKFRNVTAR